LCSRGLAVLYLYTPPDPFTALPEPSWKSCDVCIPTALSVGHNYTLIGFKSMVYHRQSTMEMTMEWLPTTWWLNSLFLPQMKVIIWEDTILPPWVLLLAYNSTILYYQHSFKVPCRQLEFDCNCKRYSFWCYSCSDHIVNISIFHHVPHFLNCMYLHNL
jgi:hypothetical protein